MQKLFNKVLSNLSFDQQVNNRVISQRLMFYSINATLICKILVVGMFYIYISCVHNKTFFYQHWARCMSIGVVTVLLSVLVRKTILLSFLILEIKE